MCRDFSRDSALAVEQQPGTEEQRLVGRLMGGVFLQEKSKGQRKQLVFRKHGS
jgi:hypothetical protein